MCFLSFVLLLYLFSFIYLLYLYIKYVKLVFILFRVCKEVFNDPLDVLRHKRKFHTSPKILLSKEELEPFLLLKNRNTCPICFKVISNHVTRAPYINHVMIHCNKPSFKCKICGTTFKRKHALSVHEKRHVVTPETAK